MASGNVTGVSNRASIYRPPRTERLPDLVGRKEVCEIVGCSTMQLHRWLTPGSGDGNGFGDDDTHMIPPAMAGSHRVWVRSDIEWWAKHVGRKRRPIGSATQ